MRYTFVLALVLVAGCSDSPTAPTASPVVSGGGLAAVGSTRSNDSPTDYVISGRVSATNGGEALGGLDVSIPGYAPVKTSADGSFRLPVASRSATYAVGISGPSVLPRTLRLAVTGSQAAALDAIVQGGPFDLAFYRQLVRGGYERPNSLARLGHFAQPPRIYLRTIDDRGAAIDPVTLDQTAAVLINAAGEMTGRFGLAGLEMGTSSRVGQSGWLTVRWSSEASRLCGYADIGVEGGSLDLFTSASSCGCGRYRIAPRVVKHELGHALGFYHTDSVNDIMWGGTWPSSQCEMGMSAREKYHAAIAYSRPNGNVDPDIDPQ